MKRWTNGLPGATMRLGAKMYGPAVRYKMDFQDNERESCINVSGL